MRKVVYKINGIETTDYAVAVENGWNDYLDTPTLKQIVESVFTDEEKDLHIEAVARHMARA